MREELKALASVYVIFGVAIFACLILAIMAAAQRPPQKVDSFSDSGSATPENKTFTDSGSPSDGDGGDGGDFLDSGENSDLIVQSIIFNKASYTPGETATVTIFLKNQGTGGTGAGYYLHSYRDGTLSANCGGGYNFTKYLNALSAGATTSYSFSFTQVTAAGTYTFRAFADGSCTIAEYDENNNQTITPHVVSNKGWDDLVVQSLTLNKTTFTCDEVATATIVIKNIGTAGTGAAFSVYTYRNLSGTATCGQAYNFETSQSALAAGETKTFSFSFAQSSLSGNYTFRTFVDGACSITESNENNNQTITTYAISNMG